VLLGALFGAFAGAGVKGAAPLMRKLALPLDLLAFAVTIYAVSPSIQAMMEAVQGP
jgi:hypothetical protein